MDSDCKRDSSAIVSWTGGKDGCYSCYRAMQDGYRIAHLLHFTNLKKTGSHELNPSLIRAQSQATGIPMLHRDFLSYEEEFKRAARELLDGGLYFDSAVFGHIETHRPLVERICQDLGVDLILPLWKKNSLDIINEMQNAGFEAILVSVRDGFLGREWLGRRIDRDFLEDLKASSRKIDPCGENGEFHTLVTDGPIFQKRIQPLRCEPFHSDGCWHLNITDFKVTDKIPETGA